MSKITEKAIIEIYSKKEKILIEKIKKIYPNFDFESEKRNRFKNIAVICEGNVETYFYNDGSINGIRIVTFKAAQDISLIETGISFIIKLKYY